MFNITDKICKFLDIVDIDSETLIIVALSGGMDSMCLLDNLKKIADIKKNKLKAIHINHNIRGKEAKRDENFVKEYCDKNNIDILLKNVYATKYSKEKKLSLEEAGRILRYKEIDNFYSEQKKFFKKVYVATAHHMNDQVETIIFNMIRGTGIRGLIGISKYNGYIIRPMLDISKNDIKEYVSKNKIPYMDDSTNNDNNITRNFIRNVLLVNLLKVNDKAFLHINDLSKTAREYEDYFEDIVKNNFENILISDKEKEIIINNVKFKELSSIIQIKILKLIFVKLVSTKKDITRTHFIDIIEMSKKEKGAHLDLPYNIIVDKKKKNLYFKKNDINISSLKKRGRK